MILTGKCKEDFEKWCKSQNDLSLGIQIPNTIGGVILHLGTNAETLPKRILTTLIIDFFDSVGICIHPRRSFLGAEFKHWYFVITDEIGCHLNNFMEVRIKNDSRQEAQTEAIKKANLIYNKKY